LDALPEARYTVAVLTVGVLISGSGTNLQAILDRVADGLAAGALSAS
jgi:6,7-dimethyl-8-ribityllumazine synthase